MNNNLKLWIIFSNYTVWQGDVPDFGDKIYNELVFLNKSGSYYDDWGSDFTFKNKDLVWADAKGNINWI